MWAWGSNSYGELGDGTTENSLIPKQIGTDKYVRVSAGVGYTLALKADGSLWAWGNNEFGQLGDGSTVNSLVPKFIGSGFSIIMAGYGFSLAEDDGKDYSWSYSWGNNSNGQLGDNTTVNKLVPTKSFYLPNPEDFKNRK